MFLSITNRFSKRSIRTYLILNALIVGSMIVDIKEGRKKIFYRKDDDKYILGNDNL